MTDPVFRRLNVMWELPDDWCEEQHIIDILASIEPRMLEMGLAERFVFVVTSVAGQLPMAHKERVIVLQTSDEGHEVPAYANDVFMTFKNYPPFGAVPDNLCAFPLGCNKDVAELPALGMAERPIDVFFIGRKEFRDEFLPPPTMRSAICAPIFQRRRNFGKVSAPKTMRTSWLRAKSRSHRAASATRPSAPTKRCGPAAWSSPSAKYPVGGPTAGR